MEKLQFLLEKLVARVVSPYLGQRGLYDGGPEPVIKVKLKPIPIHIPTSKSDKNGETITISPRKILTKEITELFKVCILFHF